MEKKRPVIGLCTSYEKNKTEDRIFINHAYLEAVRHFGGIPMVIPAEAGAEEQAYLLGQCDGLILTGGDDIDPALYGEEIINDTVFPAPERDAREPRLCAMAMERDIPILGICRGLQILNVHLGGTLYQDIPAQMETDVPHKMERPFERVIHDCFLVPDSPLARLTGQAAVGVNSFHHQAVKDVAPSLSVMARAADGIVEAVWKPDAKFLWAVQWHPEMLWTVEDNSAEIFRAFINACNDLLP